MALLLSNAVSRSAEIILLRHAEKPDSGSGLSEVGFQRATALVAFFTTRSEVIKFGAPAVIYAMKPNKPGGSIRAIQTMQPLADALNLPIRQTYSRDEVSPLAKELLQWVQAPGNAQKTLVVCWEHKVLVDIAKALGVKKLPANLGTNIYDHAWVVDFSPDAHVTGIMDVSQHLLPGDN